METITKIALYARVSLDAEAEEIRYQDPENQLAPMREACKVRGWEITGEYIDRASGGDSNRPQFIQLRADAHRYKFNKVFVWNLDRFSREGIQRTLAYINDLKQYNTGVVSYTEGWMDTSKDSPMGDLILAVLGWASQYELRKTSQRTKAGIAQRRALGVWKGGRPKGSKDKKPRKQRGAPKSQKNPATI